MQIIAKEYIISKLISPRFEPINIKKFHMKAMMKGKAADFFKKPQKKKIDPQEVLNQIQAKSIAKIIGIQEQQLPNFQWFFQQTKKIKLPNNFKKYLEQQTQQIVYQDQKGHKSKIHPQIQLLKIFFYQSLSQKKIATFQVKKEKLLPFVQQKMVRQCVAIASKRRQVEKVNLQRDQNGKMVLSKMARVKPDIKSLISARSYMLKMLVQKVYTRKQIWGKGKRANVYANIINQKFKSSNPQIEEEIIQTDESLEFYQSIFNQAYKFYQEQYGELAKIPDQILKSKLYKRSTPQNILKNILILGISKYNIELYWLARLMDSLKLPHNWSRHSGKVFDTYIYQPSQLTFDVHPSYIYIFNQMNNFRQYFNKLSKEEKFKYLKNRQMKFYDFFERPYTVDMYGLIQKQEYKLLTIDKKKSVLKGKQIQNQNKFNNDWLIIEGIRNSHLKSYAYPLINQLQKFWKNKNFNEEEWSPSVSPFGDVVWSSTVNKSSINYCPYRQTLTIYVSTQTQNMPKLTYENFKQSFSKSISIKEEFIMFKDDNESQQQKQEFNFVQNLKENFLKYYIEHVNLPLPVPYPIQNNFNQSYFYDQIFASPFNLDQGIEYMQFQFHGPQDLGQKVLKNVKKQKKQAIQQQKQQFQVQQPIWLQKIRAKLLIVNMKNKLQAQTHDIQKSKSFICQKALNYIKQYQPERLQFVQELIRNLKTKDHLVSFIQQIFDVQARQKRKSKYKDNFQQEIKMQDDIFGSEISNLQPQELQIQSQDEKKSSQQQDSNSSQDKQQQEYQPSETQSQQQQEIQKKEVFDQQKEEIIEEEIKDYSFLKNDEHYQTSPYFEKVDQETLDLLLKRKIKNKLKKYKFSQKHIKVAVKQFVQLRQDYKDFQTVRDIKKNLIITDLNAQTVPYKNQNIVKFQQNQIIKKAIQNLNKRHNDQKQKQIKQKIKQKRQIFTPANIVDKSDMFRAYQSEMDDYSADQIIQNINSIKSKKLQEERTKQLLKSTQKIIQQQNIQNETQQSIDLQPIMRIKPDIMLDPVLKHISSITKNQQFNDFRKTFTKLQKNNPEVIIKKRTKSFQKIPKQDQTATSTILKKQKSSHMSSFSTLAHINSSKDQKLIKSYKSLPKSQILSLSNSNNSCFNSLNSKTNKIFNRVCLGNTASNFLGTQSVKSRGQLAVIQARKTLIGKSRGLATYISKKY